MGKIKLAICIGDEIYQERFVKCLMNRYKEQYELHVFGRLQEMEQEADFDGYILGDIRAEEMMLSEEQRQKALLLDEENKYQEVYKLIEQLEKIIGDKVDLLKGAYHGIPRVIGVYSLTIPYIQLPFSATLADICAEKDKTVVLDLQANSGLENIRNETSQELGLEDVITMSHIGNYSKSRLSSAIGHYHAWDYIYPVKNASCLSELTKDVVKQVLTLLEEEAGYQTILMNIGDSGRELLELCDEIYLLYPKGEAGIWRERSYVEEMQKRGKDDVLHRIQRIEISSVFHTDERWDQIAEQWKWSVMGDVIRKIAMEVSTRG